jgi:polynucleotide 5'-kinase involved in rRNA processing
VERLPLSPRLKVKDDRGRIRSCNNNRLPSDWYPWIFTFALVVAWLMSCLRDTGVYPVLMIHGESGSGKTILTKLLMDIIDPRDEKALSLEPCGV